MSNTEKNKNYYIGYDNDVVYVPETDYIKITPSQVFCAVEVRNNESESYYEIETKSFDLDYDSLKLELEKISYIKLYNFIGGRKARNEDLERSTIPSFAKLFYQTFCKDLVIPNPKELMDLYLSMFCTYCGDGTYVFKEGYRCVLDKSKKGKINKKNTKKVHFTYNELAGRHLRSYCSLCREIMLLASIAQKYQELKVYYTYEADVVDGVDIIIEYKNKLYGLATFADTKDAHDHYGHKHNTFYKGNKFNIIEMPANMYGENKNTTLVGDVYVYSEEYIDSVIKSL